MVEMREAGPAETTVGCSTMSGQTGLLTFGELHKYAIFRLKHRLARLPAHRHGVQRH